MNYILTQFSNFEFPSLIAQLSAHALLLVCAEALLLSIFCFDMSCRFPPLSLEVAFLQTLFSSHTEELAHTKKTSNVKKEI